MCAGVSCKALSAWALSGGIPWTIWKPRQRQPRVAQAQQALVYLYEQVRWLTLEPIHVARAGRKRRAAPRAEAAAPVASPAGTAAPGERRPLDQIRDVLRVLHYSRRAGAGGTTGQAGRAVPIAVGT